VSDDRVESRSPLAPVGPLEAVLLALAFGLAAGTALGAWDLGRQVPEALGVDLLLVSAVGAAAGMVTALAATLLLAILSRAFRFPSSRAQWTGLLAGALVVSTVAAAVLLTKHELGRFSTWCVVMAGLPAACIAYGLFTRSPLLASRGRPQILALSVATAVLIWSGGPDLLRALAAMASNPVRSTASSARPNVVVIVLDTTRRDLLGCYGHAGGLTPKLDEIAAQSSLFDDAFSSSHWTAPAHASLFTGLPPATHGCSRASRVWLGDNLITLAETLREKGYDTAAFFSNPWMLRANLLQGFDTRIKLIARYRGLAVHDLCCDLGWPAHWSDKGGALAAGELSRWLAGRKAEQKPFLLFFNLMEAHWPYFPPRADRRAFLPDGVSFREATRFARSSQPDDLHLERSRDDHAERITRGLYEAGVRYQDRCLAEILAVLEEWTDLDNTLLIITSDHGENINDDGRWGHEFDVNDTLIRVPLIIRYPELFPPGTRIGGLCSLEDVLPTALRVVDRALPPGDHSLVPAEFAAREGIFGQMYPHLFDLELARSGRLRDVYRVHWRMLRTDRWKYIWSSDEKPRLFDLRTDPGETINLIDSPVRMAQDLERRLLEWWEAQPAFTPDGEGPVGGGPAGADMLRSLGY
jgi:arylsulfatase A-like enzyme